MIYPPVITVPNTDTFEIATAIAELSDFGRGYTPKSWAAEFGGNGKNGAVCITHIYHRSRNPHAFAAGENPDICVTALDGNRYVIEYTARVNAKLLDDFEKELREFRMRQQARTA